jgi:hypothetical protein
MKLSDFTVPTYHPRPISNAAWYTFAGQVSGPNSLLTIGTLRGTPQIDLPKDDDLPMFALVYRSADYSPTVSTIFPICSFDSMY